MQAGGRGGELAVPPHGLVCSGGAPRSPPLKAGERKVRGLLWERKVRGLLWEGQRNGHVCRRILRVRLEAEEEHCKVEPILRDVLEDDVEEHVQLGDVTMRGRYGRGRARTGEARRERPAHSTAASPGPRLAS